jgi:alkylation response protein AidB-like acyl-CoA dehydrogenase
VETEQRLPPELVEEFRAAGFYSLVMPRSMGGLQADPLTYQRVVELLAEGSGVRRLECCQQRGRAVNHAWLPGRRRAGDLRKRPRNDPGRHCGGGWRDGRAS